MTQARIWGAGENLSLSDAELAGCEPIAAEGGKTLRAFCPFHGSDNQRSLRVTVATGHFKCFACDAWGYLETARKQRRGTIGRASRPHPDGTTATLGRVSRPTPTPSSAPAPRPELAEIMERYCAALPGSLGEAYLAARSIPLAIAQRVGVGYAASGQWAHVDETGRCVRDWRRGRLVFPHTDPAGNVVSLYGRAVGDDFSDAEKHLKHDHLPGAKGYFNSQVLVGGSGPVTACEGVFDALALIAAGAPRVVAIFGVNGWRWEWATDVRELIFALDGDPAGQAGVRELARAATIRGKRVAYLESDTYGGEKDAAAAWHAGTLTPGDWREVFPAPAPEPAQTRQGSESAREIPVPPTMLWGEALQACEGLNVRPKHDAYALSHTYLNAGPESLAGIEAELREEVAALSAGSPLPDMLAVEVFAWKNAAYMARRRRDDDLSPVWVDPAQAAQRQRFPST